MDNNQKSVGEEMAETVVKLKDQFFRMKAEKEAQMNPDQKREYDKLVNQSGMNNAIEEFENKFNQIRDLATNMSKPSDVKS